MTESEVLELVREARDGMGRVRFGASVRAQVTEYLRAEQSRGVTSKELSSRFGISEQSISKWTKRQGTKSSPKRRASKFSRLKIQAERKAVVIEGAHGLRVRCNDAASAAAVLVAASRAD